MVVIRGRLAPEVGAVLMQALAAARETQYQRAQAKRADDVPAETSRRLACNATRVVMQHDVDGHITEVGARTRTIPPALRRALQHRDRGCRFPGCGRTFGQGHHIRHWARGGPTTLSNLTMLCRRQRHSYRRADIEARLARRTPEP